MIDMRDARSAGKIILFIRIIDAVGKDINFSYSTFYIVPSMYPFQSVSRRLQLSSKAEIASLSEKYSNWWYTQHCQTWEIMGVGGEGKREDSRFQLKDFQIKLPWQSRTNKNWHFFKAITNGCKKRQDKTMAKPLCASGAKSCWIPAQSWKNNWKTCYTSSLQFLGHFVQAQGHLCSHLLQEKPLLLAQGSGTATLLFSSFSHNPQYQDPCNW